MLTVYADDAGNFEEHEYVLVAGYIALQAQWERFCSDWRIRLACAGLPEFHANKFFNGVGIFAGWNKSEHKRERENLLKDLAEIIGEYVKHAFTCIVHVPGWNRLNEEFYLAECQFTPHVMSGRTVVTQARAWAQAAGYNPDKVEYIFDQGNAHWGKLKNRLKVDLDIDAHEGDRRKIRPLQAADWFAYEEFRDVRSSDRRIYHKPRGSFGLLLEVPNIPLIYRQAGIRNLCLNPEMLIPKRSTGASVRTRIGFDQRRMDRVQRRWKRLRKDAPKLLNERLHPALTATIRGLQREYQDVTARLQRAIDLKIPVTQGEDHIANLRIQRELFEQQVALMEKIVALLKSG